MALAAFVALALAGRALSADCSVPPIYIDVHKRGVHGSSAVEYGTFAGFGSAAQNQSLWVSLSGNETVVAEPDFCKKSSIVDCDRRTGGFFEREASSTWKQVDDYKSADQAGGASNVSGVFGQDKIHLYQHFIESEPATETVVEDFPVLVAANGSADPGRIGLGQKSTLLDRLAAQNLIAGRSFSLYTGTGMEPAGGAINGSLTLGGYDATRFTGTVYNETLDASATSPFKVHVSDIIVNDSSGGRGGQSNLSLFDKTRFPNLSSGPAGFDAVISTDDYPLSLPDEVTQNLMAALGVERSDRSDGLLPLKNAFAGSLTIALSNGLRVTLPAEVLVKASGLFGVADAPKPASNATGAPPASAPTLGLAFLTQVYLMADYDAGQFHLAQAVHAAPFISVRTTCPRTVPVAYARDPVKPFGRLGLVGVVVGAVVGGIGLLFLSWWALAHLVALRRHRQAKRAQKEALELKTRDLEAS